jgi:hypothetical protein
MFEYIIGFMVGVVFMGLAELIHAHNKRIKRTVAQEKEYAVLQQHVDKAVDSIERIIYGSKP